MKKEAAIKSLKNHINGNFNKISNYILNDIAYSIKKAGGIPPFKIIKIGQLAEEIENIVDDGLHEVQNSEHVEDQKDDPSEEHPSENEPYFSTSGPATYNIQNDEFTLTNMKNIIFTDIKIEPTQDQIKVLMENVGDDKMTVNGQATLMSMENNTSGANIPHGYDGVVIFTPLSKNNQIINDNIYGYYSI